MSDRKPIQRTIRGGRAFFFLDSATDKVLNMVVTLAGEVWALRERLAAMETIGVRRGSLIANEVDELEFTPEQDAALAADRKEFIENLFRVLQEQVDAAARAGAAAKVKAPKVKSTGVKSAAAKAPKPLTHAHGRSANRRK